MIPENLADSSSLRLLRLLLLVFLCWLVPGTGEPCLDLWGVFLEGLVCLELFRDARADRSRESALVCGFGKMPSLSKLAPVLAVLLPLALVPNVPV